MPETPLTRDELARELVALRRRVDLSVGAVAKRIGVAQSTLSRWEGGKYRVPADKLADLAHVYGVDAAGRARLMGGSRDEQPKRQRVFLHRPEDAADRQRGFGERERESSRVSTLGATLVPGLLQTERYMRAVVTAGGRLTGERLEEWVVNRLWRQQILTESGREFVQLILPGPLLWCADSHGAMLEQIDRLVVATRLPGVRLGVVPAGKPVDVFPLHNVDLYDLRDGRREAVVGTLAGTEYLDDPEDVEKHAALLEKVERLAVFGEDARQELRRVASLYR